jgi:hypothetical protein
MPEGSEDIGYPQHKELREKIVEYWEKNPNMKELWEYISSL